MIYELKASRPEPLFTDSELFSQLLAFGINLVLQPSCDSTAVPV